MTMKFNYGYDPRDLNLEVAGYSGNNEVIVKCPNPDHNDTNPSACFNTETGLLYCFSCGYSANHVKLANLAGTIASINTKVLPNYKKDSENLWSDFKKLKKAYDNPYLIKRGVSNENVEYFDIRQTTKGIVFLFRDFAQNFVGCQMRQYEGFPKYLTFGKRIVFPENKLGFYNPEKPVILTEGVFGAIRGFNAGFQTLAVIGAMIKYDTVRFLNNWGEIYGFFDDDFAGYVAGARLLNFVPRAKIIVRGDETDELSYEGWKSAIESNDNKTRSIRTLAEFVEDKAKFRKIIG